MLYIPATNTIITNAQTRYVHPGTGVVYGRTDYEDPVKLAEIGAVPLRILTPVDGLPVVEWVIEDDTLSIYAGAKVHRPVMLRDEPLATGVDAVTWEVIDDPAHPGDKLRRAAQTTPWTITAADVEAKTHAITVSRYHALSTLTITYNTWTIQADPASRANLTALIAAINAGIPVGETVAWRDADDVDRLLTPAQLVEMAGLMLQATLAVYQQSWNMKNAVAAITDPVELRGYDTTVA